MKQKLIALLLALLSKLTGKKFLYITPSELNTLGKTAAWCSLGFWYAGNVYDSTDIAYGIAQNGIIEKEDTMLVDRILRSLAKIGKDLVVFDIGSNTGFYGVLAAKKHGARVESFDPVAEHIDCLKKTLKINNITTLTTHTIALGAEEDELQLQLAGSGSTLAKDFLGGTHTQTRTVPVKRLDDLGLNDPHFIKIDVEGYEYPVLSGAKLLIQRAKPICFVEISKTFKARHLVNQNFDSTIAFFTDLNYNAYLHDGDKLIPVGGAVIPDGVRMYLFVPPWYTEKL